MKAGPTLNNQASDDNSRRTTGQSAPVTFPTTQPSLDDATFQCEFPGCERSFQTTIGRGQHQRRMHKVWYEQRIIAERRTFGWTLEESSLLAHREAELSVPQVHAINQALQQAFPYRTIAAISQHQRSQAHKDLVTHYTSQLRVLPGGTASPLPSPTEPTPGQSEVSSPPDLCTYSYRTCRELIPSAIKQNASTTSCATTVTPPKAPSSSGYLVICGTSFHLARPTTNQQWQPTNSNRRAGKPDAENTPRRRDTGAPTACDVSRTSWETSRMPSSHLEPRWSLTGQQYSHSRQPSPCLNAHNTPSRTPLRVRSKQRRSEQLDPPWPFHQVLTVSRFVSFESSHWESSSGSLTLSSGERICPNTWKSPERSSSSRNLRLLCLENSVLSPSPLSLLGSYIRY